MKDRKIDIDHIAYKQVVKKIIKRKDEYGGGLILCVEILAAQKPFTIGT